MAPNNTYKAECGTYFQLDQSGGYHESDDCNSTGSDSASCMEDSDDSEGASSPPPLDDQVRSGDSSPVLLRRQMTSDQLRLGNSKRTQRLACIKPYQTVKHAVEPKVQQQVCVQQPPEDEVGTGKAVSSLCDPKQTQRNLVMFITSVVSLASFDGFKCHGDAGKLAKVTISMTESNQLYKFLEVFSHSISCTTIDCHNLCRMFKRTRAHVASAKHSCAIMQVYSQLLRLHIDTCLSDDCGLITCKSMLAMRVKARNSVLPRNFKCMEEMIALKLKQADANEKAIIEEDIAPAATIDVKNEKIELPIVKSEQEETVTSESEKDDATSDKDDDVVLTKCDPEELFFIPTVQQITDVSVCALDLTKKRHSVGEMCQAIQACG